MVRGCFNDAARTDTAQISTLDGPCLSACSPRHRRDASHSQSDAGAVPPRRPLPERRPPRLSHAPRVTSHLDADQEAPDPPPSTATTNRYYRPTHGNCLKLDGIGQQISPSLDPRNIIMESAGRSLRNTAALGPQTRSCQYPSSTLHLCDGFTAFSSPKIHSNLANTLRVATKRKGTPLAAGNTCHSHLHAQKLEFVSTAKSSQFFRSGENGATSDSSSPSMRNDTHFVLCHLDAWSIADGNLVFVVAAHGMPL